MKNFEERAAIEALYEDEDEELHEISPEQERAIHIAEVAEWTVQMIEVGYAAEFSGEDKRDFYAMVRELLRTR